MRPASLAPALALLLALPAAARAQKPSPPAPFLPVPTYTAEQDRAILAAFDGLRVADVSDGMDAVGLPGTGLVDPAFGPLWRDTDTFAHRVCGVAVTVRYVPTNRRVPTLSPETFADFEGRWYREVSPEPFVPLLRPGSVVVIDGDEDGDTGTIGSNNALGWKAKGAVGIVTSGGARDTDELIKQRIPLYFRKPGRGIRPGRNEVESVNRPVTLGGVLVRPGDVVVADGDGVVVVPREQAEAVARVARKILESDKAGRRKLYEQLKLPLDSTVEPGR
jgi:regulator of RNase E activity RraA